MRIVFVVAMVGLMLTGCAQSRRDYDAVGGAVVGGGTGAVIGGLATRSLGGAVAGGVIGAAAGGIIGAAASHDGRCYARTRSGKLRRVRCY
jgi:hypothetical protein